MGGVAIKISNCSNVKMENITVKGFEKICEIDKDSEVSIRNSKIINSTKSTNEKFIRGSVPLRIGRNDECSCGSNKKYKKCCLKILNDFNLNNSKNICLIVGNGLNISGRSYLKNTNQEIDMDTYKFLSWNVKSPQDNVSFLEQLPVLDKILKNKDEEDDFKKVNYINKVAKNIIETSYNDYSINEGSILLCEIKHYIAIAFSHFQKKFDEKDISKWEVTKFLKALENKIGYIVSLNYDLVLETAMDTAKIKYRREGVTNEYSGIGILKPHGSIDYDVSGIDVPIKYPIRNVIDKNDFPIKKIDRENLLESRTEVDIVLPLEYSYQTDYQWIKPGYDKIKRNGSEFTDLIIFGVSYWDCDRPEIDKIIDSLENNTKITIIDPKINDDLKLKLYSKFGKERVEIIKEIDIN